MIEHFSKWLDLVPLLYHNNEKIVYAFSDNVFNKFGILNEVLIDQGTKFHGKFQELWDRTLINHCTTSQDHFLSRQIN
jgi:hypothetical protein